MKRFVLALLAAFLSIPFWAIKVQPGATIVRQSDGTQLTVVGHGNCDVHWYTTTDGVLLSHQGFDYFVARIDEQGRLFPTSQLAHEKSLRNDAENELIRLQDQKLFMSKMTRELQTSARREPVKDNSTYFPHMGSPRAIVILAQFQDSVFIDEDPKPVFEQYLNAEGSLDRNVGNGTVYRNHGSVRRYFSEMSNGLFTPQFDIYGPVTLSKGLKHYGEGEDNLSRLIPETCRLAHDAGLDFSQYDENSDGYVDLVYIIYAGYAECITGNSSDCIWPCSGTVYGGTYDGKQVLRFGVHAERNGYPGAWSKPRIGGIGLFCHEFSHSMGLPDIYHTTTEPQHGVLGLDGRWGICTKRLLSHRIFGLGARGFRLDADRYTRSVRHLRTGSVGNRGRKGLPRIERNDPTKKEYLLLQNIQATGFNRILAEKLGHGLLVSHVEYDQNAFSLESNSVNNVIGHPRYTFIPADNEYISSYSITGNTPEEREEQMNNYLLSHAGDPFPGSTQNHNLTPITFYTGNSVKQILDINEDTSTGLVSFTYSDPNFPSSITVLEAQTASKGQYYSVDGRCMGNDKSKLRPGIYIVNGHKAVIK